MKKTISIFKPKLSNPFTYSLSKSSFHNLSYKTNNQYPSLFNKQSINSSTSSLFTNSFFTNISKQFCELRNTSVPDINTENILTQENSQSKTNFQTIENPETELTQLPQFNFPVFNELKNIDYAWAHNFFNPNRTKNFELPIINIKSLTYSNNNFSLPRELFTPIIRKDIIHRVYYYNLNYNKVSFKRTKSKGMVAGSGVKPMRQKGNGRARQGNKRSPIFRKGGHTFAIKPKSFFFPLNKKIRLQGLQQMLTVKLMEKQILIFDDLNVKKITSEEEYFNTLCKKGKQLYLKGKTNDYYSINRQINGLFKQKTELQDKQKTYSLKMFKTEFPQLVKNKTKKEIKVEFNKRMELFTQEIQDLITKMEQLKEDSGYNSKIKELFPEKNDEDIIKKIQTALIGNRGIIYSVDEREHTIIENKIKSSKSISLSSKCFKDINVKNLLENRYLIFTQASLKDFVEKLLARKESYLRITKKFKPADKIQESLVSKYNFNFNPYSKLELSTPALKGSYKELLTGALVPEEMEDKYFNEENSKNTQKLIDYKERKELFAKTGIIKRRGGRAERHKRLIQAITKTKREEEAKYK